jgi:hypothetical protein
VPTSAGALEERGIRRLYHAAVAEPVTASNDYLVAGPTIARAVSCCFELARAERTNFTPPLASICFPLIGAGRAGLDPAVSFSWLWPVIAAETGRDERWHVHLSTWTAAEAIVVLRALIRTVSDAARSGGPPSPSP